MTGGSLVPVDGSVGTGSAVVPAGVQWTHADQTRNERGKFPRMPYRRDNTAAEFAVITQEKRGGPPRLIVGCSLMKANELCSMNGDGIAWAFVDDVITNGAHLVRTPIPPPIPWERRGPDVVLSHFNPRSRPPEGVLVAMQTELIGREVYLLGFYDHNEEQWCVLSKPGFIRRPMREPPLRWASVEDAIRAGLRESK